MRFASTVVRCVLPVVLFALSAVLAPASAQGSTGSIFGHGPAGAVVTAVNATGAQRHATINAKGRYVLSSVPMGTWSVALEKDGQVADTRKNIGITVGRGAEVDFACPNDNCAAAE